MTMLMGMIVMPVSAGTIVSLMLLRRSLGRVRLHRVLEMDKSSRPIWKLVATCYTRPAKRCRISAGGQDLVWEGVGTTELDLQEGGVGVAYIPFELDHRATITVKSGPYTILRSNFRNIEEVILN